MIVHPVIRFAIPLCFILSTCVVRADEQFDALLARVPDTANSLTMIDVTKVFASEMAAQQGWRQEHAQRFDAAPSMLPPTTEQFVWASELNLKYMTPDWQVAVMNLSQDLSMDKLAKWIRGQTDTVAGLESVATQRGGMVVKFSQKEYGMIKPGNRQKAARWIRDTSRRTASLSPYLARVVADPARTGADLFKAFDLTDALDRTSVRAAMANSQVVKQASLNPDQVADLLASVRGMTLSVRFTDRATATFTVDFDGDVSILGNAAKPLLLEVLNEAGAAFDELDGWQLSLGEKQFSLEGELVESGIRRLFSFLEIDAAVVEAGESDSDDAATTTTEVSPAEKGSLTREYFHGVTNYIDDLGRERGANSYGTIALWFEKYARRIEALPILNVDPDMLDYSASVVSHFRGAADSIRAGGIKTGARTAQVWSGDYGYGRYGYGYPVFGGSTNYAVAQTQAAEADRRAIRAEERAASSLDARGHMSQVKDDTTAVRRMMTERYQMEF